MAKNPLPPDNSRSRAAYLRFPIVFGKNIFFFNSIESYYNNTFLIAGSILGMFYIGFLYRYKYFMFKSQVNFKNVANSPCV